MLELAEIRVRLLVVAVPDQLATDLSAGLDEDAVDRCRKCGVASFAAATILMGDTLTGRADNRRETCIPTSAKSTEFASRWRTHRRSGGDQRDHGIAGMNSAASRGYLLPEMIRCFGYTGNVDVTSASLFSKKKRLL